MPAGLAIDTDQATVIEAVLARLRSEVTGATEKTCFLTAKPLDDPPDAVMEDRFFTVSPTDGRFGGPEHEGGGESFTLEYTGLIVVVYSRVKLDPSGRDDEVLANHALGMLGAKREILTALSGFNPESPDGSPLLANVMAPITSGSPSSGWGRKNGKTWADMSVTFSTDISWELEA